MNGKHFDPGEPARRSFRRAQLNRRAPHRQTCSALRGIALRRHLQFGLAHGRCRAHGVPQIPLRVGGAAIPCRTHKPVDARRPLGHEHFVDVAFPVPCCHYPGIGAARLERASDGHRADELRAGHDRERHDVDGIAPPTRTLDPLSRASASALCSPRFSPPDQISSASRTISPRPWPAARKTSKSMRSANRPKCRGKLMDAAGIRTIASAMPRAMPLGRRNLGSGGRSDPRPRRVQRNRLE